LRPDDLIGQGREARGRHQAEREICPIQPLNPIA
jgi:hypothetical protein